MWFALNRFQFEPHLKEWLLDEQIVVAEDYTGTGLAWGAVKGLDLEWLEQINAPLIKEDIALLMDGERFKEASENGHRHESDEDAMQRARQIHLALAAKYDWKIVSAKGTLEEVEARLWDQIRLHLPQK
jgi:thymidylate kinase